MPEIYRYENCCYVNFDFEKGHKAEFALTKDLARIVSYLTSVKGMDIKPEKTLIIFDEIQECNDALNSLKYFRELMPEQVVVCAGSLLWKRYFLLDFWKSGRNRIFVSTLRYDYSCRGKIGIKHKIKKFIGIQKKIST